MSAKDLDRHFKEANRISDRFVKLINDELADKVNAVQVLAGFMLAFEGYLRSVPTDVEIPESLLHLEKAVFQVMNELIELERHHQ